MALIGELIRGVVEEDGSVLYLSECRLRVTVTRATVIMVYKL